MWDSLTPEEQQEFWNGMSQSEQIAFAQAMEHPHQVQPKPDQAKGAKSRLFQQGSRPIFTYTEAMKTRAGEKKLSLYRTNFKSSWASIGSVRKADRQRIYRFVQLTISRGVFVFASL